MVSPGVPSFAGAAANAGVELGLVADGVREEAVEEQTDVAAAASRDVKCIAHF